MEVSVNEAARRLGVSQEAVRSRLRDGELKGRQVPRGRRRLWLVDAEDLAVWEARRRSWQEVDRLQLNLVPDSPEPTPEAQAVGEQAAGGIDERDAEIARLRRQVAALKGALVALMDP
jgi:excisionase family DNA binding protein